MVEFLFLVLMGLLPDRAWARAEPLLAAHGDYPYHNIAHTRRVIDRAAFLAEREGFAPDEREDLLLAAIFHDTGFADRYDANEPLGAAYARDFLEKAGHPRDRIDRVVRLVLATVPGTLTTDALERAMQDSDLDNLGCDDGLARTDDLYVELTRHAGKTLSRERWLSASLGFFERYAFQTETAKKDREPARLRNVEKLRGVVASGATPEVPRKK